MSVTVNVPMGARLRLAHGCLQYLAVTIGARTLHVKGVALHPVLSEGRAPSTDCDVLVHPDHLEAFCAGLEAQDWEMLTSFGHGSVFQHAATYYHRVWGTVDVHRTFPGLDDDPRVTFERLWASHELVELGGVECPVPDLLGQRLLLLVHAARDAMGRRHRDVRAAWSEANAQEKARIDELARELGATVPMALATGREEMARGQRGEHVWRAVHRNAHPSDVWSAMLRDASTGRERLRVLIAALHVNPDHLALRLGHAPNRQELRKEWWDRWSRLARRVRSGRPRRGRNDE